MQNFYTALYICWVRIWIFTLIWSYGFTKKERRMQPQAEIFYSGEDFFIKIGN
jgi:hypothetical protein